MPRASVRLGISGQPRNLSQGGPNEDSNACSTRGSRQCRVRIRRCLSAELLRQVSRSWIRLRNPRQELLQFLLFDKWLSCWNAARIHNCESPQHACQSWVTVQRSLDLKRTGGGDLESVIGFTVTS